MGRKLGVGRLVVGRGAVSGIGGECPEVNRGAGRGAAADRVSSCANGLRVHTLVAEGGLQSVRQELA